MRTPRTFVYAISPGRPVVSMPALWTAETVSAWPAAPKSIAWLFARFITVNPACLRYDA